MTKKSLTRDIPPIAVRMPSKLREPIERAAQAAGRSLNAEIVQRLRESVGAEPAKTGMKEAVPGHGGPRPLDTDLLEACLLGAFEALRGRGVELAPDKLAQLVTLLYEHYLERDRDTAIASDVTFSRFMRLLT